MGGQQSSMNPRKSPKKNDEFSAPDKMKLPNVLDHIATKYITSANFKDMENLHQKEYCDKLLIITQKVIEKNLNGLEIMFLNQRTKNGIQVNEMARAPVVYLAKDNINSIDVNSEVKKHRMCVGIAKFYVKIAHLFAAINKTINPTFSYTDIDGNKQTVPLMDKSTIPKGVQIKLSKMNMCSRRIAALKPTQNNENGIIIKGKNCNMNKKVNSIMTGGAVGEMFDVTARESTLPPSNRDANYSYTPDNFGPMDSNLGSEDIITSELGSKTLLDEIGIPELVQLYYDEYDYNTGKYHKMSKEGKEQYDKDLFTFYTTFTGNKEIPKDNTGVPKVKKFGDIKLMDFHNQELCTNPDSPWLKSYRGDINDDLFKQYADNIKQMVEKTKNQENSLLAIFEKVFSYWIDPKTKEKKLTIRPDLTMDKLNEIVAEARNIIVELYLNCEKDFQEGLAIFEAIIKKKMLEKSQRAVKNFNKKRNELMSVDESKPPAPAAPAAPPAPAAPLEQTKPKADPNASALPVPFSPEPNMIASTAAN